MVNMHLSGVEKSVVFEMGALHDLHTLSWPEFMEQLEGWNTLGWNSAKRVHELLTKKKHITDFIDG
jgi:hypothetical protein